MIEKDFVRFLEVVNRRTGVSIPEILGKCRVTRIAIARQLICWLMRNEGWDYVSISKLLHCYHGTVIHSCRKINFLIGVDRAFNRVWPELSGQEIVFTGSEARKEYKRKHEEKVGA